MNIKGTVLKEIIISFIVDFYLSKYKLIRDTFWKDLVGTIKELLCPLAALTNKRNSFFQSLISLIFYFQIFSFYVIPYSNLLFQKILLPILSLDYNYIFTLLGKWGNLRRLIINVSDCSLEVSEFALQLCFRTNPLEKVYFPNHFSTKIALALSYPQRVICH